MTCDDLLAMVTFILFHFFSGSEMSTINATTSSTDFFSAKPVYLISSYFRSMHLSGQFVFVVVTDNVRSGDAGKLHYQHLHLLPPHWHGVCLDFFVKKSISTWQTISTRPGTLSCQLKLSPNLTTVQICSQDTTKTLDFPY